VARALTFEVVCDTSHFTPHQLNPAVVSRWAMEAWFRWVRRYLVSFRELVSVHGWSNVVAGCQLVYHAPLSVLDADVVDVRVQPMRVRRDRHMLELALACHAADALRATIELTFITVQILDATLLTARTAPIPEAFVTRYFAADEIDPSRPPRPFPDALAKVRENGALIGRATTPLAIPRHRCEAADQWFFAKIPDMTGEAREAMALGERSDPTVRHTLSQPMLRLDYELYRPFFAFDSGRVESWAYRLADEIAFVHELRSHAEPDWHHGTVIERFARQP
jgi:acyl-CoA thioesterase FadM